MLRTTFLLSVVTITLQAFAVGPVHCESISVWVDGEFVGWALEFIEGRTFVPLRSIAQALGVDVRYNERLRCVFMGRAVDGLEMMGSAVPGSASFPKIYVDGRLVGFGLVRSGVTYVPLRLMSESLGANVDYLPHLSKIRVTGQGKTPVSLLPGVPIGDTAGRWWPVENTERRIWFRNAIATDFEFTAELKIEHGFFKPTSKPISVEFVVVAYGADGAPLAQDSTTVFGVSSRGGHYILRAFAAPFSDVASCSLVYSAAWVPR